MKDASEDEQEADFIHNTAAEKASYRKSKAEREEQLRKMMDQEGIIPHLQTTPLALTPHRRTDAQRPRRPPGRPRRFQTHRRPARRRTHGRRTKRSRVRRPPSSRPAEGDEEEDDQGRGRIPRYVNLKLYQSHALFSTHSPSPWQ